MLTLLQSRGIFRADLRVNSNAATDFRQKSKCLGPFHGTSHGKQLWRVAASSK